MKLQREDQSGQYLFTGYGSGYVAINHQPYQHSLVLTPQRVIVEWKVVSFDKLSAGHFEFLAALKAEILLLGTGATLRFPAAALTRCLLAEKIGLEVMDTKAACRTYNILASDGRNVAAAVLVS